MNPILKNILAVIAGLIVGNIVNMSLIQVSGSIIPFPDGYDNTTMEGLESSMLLLEPKHFIMPFLAHALGTLSGAFVVAKIAATRKMLFALIIGGFFLLGGTMMIFMLPSPILFNAIDLMLAYIPMAWIGWKLAGGNTSNQNGDALDSIITDENPS